MADTRTIFRIACDHALSECAPHHLPCIAGNRVGFSPYDNGFNLWPESCARVVLGVAFCRSGMGALMVTRDSARAARFIWAV